MDFLELAQGVQTAVRAELTRRPQGRRALRWPAVQATRSPSRTVLTPPL